jgi:hypothetical protein
MPNQRPVWLPASNQLNEESEASRDYASPFKPGLASAIMAGTWKFSPLRSAVRTSWCITNPAPCESIPVARSASCNPCKIRVARRVVWPPHGPPRPGAPCDGARASGTDRGFGGTIREVQRFSISSAQKYSRNPRSALRMLFDWLVVAAREHNWLGPKTSGISDHIN